MLEIREVKTRSELKRFVTFPNKLYRDVPQYIPPLVSDDMADWNRKANPAFAYSEARCWLAYRDGEIVGRIGAILNRSANRKWKTRRMRFTQVDFIDDREVPDALFQAVEDWARETHCDEVHGPLGFTDLDREGMLVEGFDRKGMFITYYNHPYYPEHLTRLGYVKDVDWVEFLIDVPAPEDPLTGKLERLSARIQRMQKLHIAELRRRSEYKPYIRKVFELINICYAHLYGTVDLSDQQIDKYSEKFIPLINPELAAFVMDANENMVGFAVAAPSIADASKRHGGRLFPTGFIDVLRALRTNDTLDLFLIAVHPDYQDRGVNAILMNHILKGCHRLGIVRAETGPQLECNTKIQNQWKLFNYTAHKRRRCFVKKIGA